MGSSPPSTALAVTVFPVDSTRTVTTSAFAIVPAGRATQTTSPRLAPSLAATLSGCGDDTTNGADDAAGRGTSISRQPNEAIAMARAASLVIPSLCPDDLEGRPVER